jgi:hypothetical protein
MVSTKGSKNPIGVMFYVEKKITYEEAWKGTSHGSARQQAIKDKLSSFKKVSKKVVDIAAGIVGKGKK